MVSIRIIIVGFLFEVSGIGGCRIRRYRGLINCVLYNKGRRGDI